MAYNLPPISTLSAALGGDAASSIQINPDLLDDPTNQSNGQDTNDRHDTSNQHQQWTAESHYQVDESTGNIPWIDDQTQSQHVEAPAEGENRPRKKPRARYSTTNADMTALINEATIAEYEDPGGDFRAGAVYVHPPSSVNQACVRCHRIKRKCDNAKPRCTGCWKADTPCVFEISPATAAFVTSIKNDHTSIVNQLQMAQQRVANLEAQLAQSSSFPTHNDGLPEQPGSSSTFPHPPAEVENYYTGFAQTILGIDQSSLIPAHSSSHGELPNLETAQKAARTFFDNHSRQYVFLNKGEFMVDLQNIWEEQVSAVTSEDGKRKEFIVMMITSVGAYLGEAKGDIDTGTSKTLREKALRTLGAAISKNDLVTVQAYLALLSSVLLGLHPDLSPSHVLALALQSAISLDLHRKRTTSPADAELRNRIWWTIYNHERSLDVGSGRPLSIADGEIDADLPSAQNEDETTDIDHINRIIAYNRLLGEIYVDQSTPGITVDASEKSRRLKQGLENWLEAWSASDDDEISRSDGRLLYNQALYLLYRPISRARVPDNDDLELLGRTADEAIHTMQGTKSSLPVDLHALLWRYQTAITRLYVTCKTGGKPSKEQIETCRNVVAVPTTQFADFQELRKLKLTFEGLVNLQNDEDQLGKMVDDMLFDLQRPVEGARQK